MSSDTLLVVVTGGVARGKTTFLERLQAGLGRGWRSCGFFCLGEHRRHGCGEASAVYRLRVIGRPGLLPWAKRDRGGVPFEFCEDARAEVCRAVGAQLESGACELCFLDEIGPLELAGGGFAPLLRQALASSCKAVVAAVKKRCLAEVWETFGIAKAVVIDLDVVDARRALPDARRRIAALDAERIGAFAGIAGLLEVGLGSTLHAYRVPLKGQVLVQIQNVLLIAFGKALRGRGLVRIAFISAMLKAFSPLGNTVRPMVYIFLQGLSFAAPVRLFGWNAGAVLAGSVLMSWLSLGLSLAVDYASFGRSIFDAIEGAIGAASGWIGVRGPSLFQVLAGAFALKAVVAIILGVLAYYGNLEPFIHRLSARRNHVAANARAENEAPPERRSPSRVALFALRDLLKPRFAIAFLVSGLLLLFFAGLSKADALNLLVRGLCISYLGFVVMRRIDVRCVGDWLDRRAGLGLGRSLPVALGVLGREPRDAPPPAASADSPASAGTQAVARQNAADVAPGAPEQIP
jgi:nucleoside-triphosphatase THEP1